MKLKEVKFRPRTDRHDLEHKMKKVNEFLAAGDRVRLIVTFRGRELAHKDLGEKLLFNLLDLCPPNTYVGPIRDEPRSVSVDLMVRKH
jgi:translation initiation factor IF-3